MATLEIASHHSERANAMATANLTTGTLSDKHLAAAIYAALGKIASKEGVRDDLPDGVRHDFRLSIDAEIDGQPYSAAYDGAVSVGHSSTRASAVTPNATERFAYALSKVNAATRKTILAAIAAPDAPEPPADIVADLESALAKLRKTVQQPVRGSVKVDYAPAVPALRVVG